ncbi:MAG: MarC family protein, partial [Candidatus Dormibacteria bacterium]
FNMVFAKETDTQEASAATSAARPAADPSIFPLAIPIITGPGALTAIVTLYGKDHGNPLAFAAITLIAVVVMLLTYATMRGSQAITKLLGTTGVDAVGRLVGIVVAAIAIQLVIDGVAEVSRGAIRTF